MCTTYFFTNNFDLQVSTNNPNTTTNRITTPIPYLSVGACEQGGLTLSQNRSLREATSVTQYTGCLSLPYDPKIEKLKFDKTFALVSGKTVVLHLNGGRAIPYM